MRRLLIALPLIWLSGCATNDAGLCPESKGLRCVAGTDCSNDSSRGCRVCQCSSALSPSPPAYNPMRDPASTGRVTDPSQPIR